MTPKQTTMATKPKNQKTRQRFWMPSAILQTFHFLELRSVHDLLPPLRE
jgi:hypothetical protein